MKPRIWPLYLVIIALLGQNFFLRLEMTHLRQNIDRIISIQEQTIQAVSVNSESIKQNAQSIHQLSDASVEHSQSIRSLIKALYVIWQKREK